MSMSTVGLVLGIGGNALVAARLESKVTIYLVLWNGVALCAYKKRKDADAHIALSGRVDESVGVPSGWCVQALKVQP